MGCELSSGSVLGAALSLAVTTMGAGILTLPSAYADAGIFLASFLLLFVAFITVYSVDFIIQAVEKLGLNSYEEITRELLGRKAEEIVRWMLLVYNIGSAIGYLVVISDLFEPMQPLITSFVPFLTTPKHTLVAFWFFVILPLSCVPKLGALHVSSFLAIFATCTISCMIVFRFFVPGPTDATVDVTSGAVTAPSPEDGPVFVSRLKNTAVSWWLGRHPLLALPIIMFSFDCQSLVFQIYANLDDMRRKTMFSVSVISLLVSGAIHAAVGLFGYLTNPVDVRDNVISNYDPSKDPLFAVGYIIYAIPINLAFVLLLFPIRDSIFILWYGFSSASVATHVPRRKDFTRIVDAEEKLEEQLSVLESVRPTPFLGPAKIRSGLTSLKNSFALPSVFGKGSERDGLVANGGVPHARYDHFDPSGAPSETGSNQNPSVHLDGHPSVVNDHDSELYEKARSEQLQLRHRKKLQNDVEVISFRDHLIVSITLSTCCVAVALVMPGIVSVVALLGGICSSTLCFTCPALYRYALNRLGIATFKKTDIFEWAVMAIMLLFGVVGGILGTFVAVKVLFV